MNAHGAEVSHGNIPIYCLASGLNLVNAKHVLAWGHGWGVTSESFASITALLNSDSHNIVFDFPGFGKSPPPPQSWGTADYADAIAEELIRRVSGKSIVWVGHSFGGRVGIQLASRHPQLLSGLILIASAGVPRRRSPAQKIKIWSKVRTYKIAKRFAPVLGIRTEELQSRFGSADYRSAGEMRNVLLRVIGEDLSDISRKISCPTLLLYGSQDTETPPEIAERLARLIPKSHLSVLPGHDHYSILDGGRHLVVSRIETFLEQL